MGDNMIMTMYEMPLPNNGERYDLSQDELDELLHKAYRNGWKYGYELAEVKYNKSMTTSASYPNDSIPKTINAKTGEWTSEWR